MPKEDAQFFNRRERTMTKHWLKLFAKGKCNEEKMETKIPRNHKQSGQYWWW